jgi:hypothetical protein
MIIPDQVALALEHLGRRQIIAFQVQPISLA